MTTYPAVEHREQRPPGWVRARRYQLALLVGVAETLVILFTDATWRWALVLAAVVFLLHFLLGRKSRYESVRQFSWAAAASQIMPVLVPVLAVFVATIAIAAVIVLALVVLAMLVLNRH